MAVIVNSEAETKQPAFGKNGTEYGLNIHNSSLFMFIGCTHVFRLFDATSFSK
jgi:hypothetical protein